ncbi:aromatic compound dioxygenase, putative [Rhizoctonia solani AG-3 Rhs1AP]|uniref:Aromatic compound dioxygenase, putative n=1 Tax=Rhizoctonia solani AG-3 Rhs1AP TaxID=1086054 RepID=X8JBB6_9AGAM|nr:aromatic compound dioxygenase, putative [Rhizoctonia solani AG-3 Rhs1AP]
MVQTNYSVATNGSIISHAGQVLHVGQIFFDEHLNTQTRTINNDDDILAAENADGYNAFAAAQLLGAEVSKGVLAYITLGVDTSFKGSIINTNYVTNSAHSNVASATAT